MVIKQYDTLVVGGGPAGMAAALAAARAGRKTALLERYGCLGGGMTSSYVRPFLGSVKNANIGCEIEKRIADAESFCSPVEAAKIVLAEMAHEAGIDVYLQTQAVSAKTVPTAESRRVESVAAVSHGTEYTFTADAYIDATGDGDLAAVCGAEFFIGRDSDGLVQPMSVMFTVEGIEPDTGLVCRHEEDWQDLGDGREYLDLCRRACESGELPPSVNIVRLYETGRRGERMVNATQLNRVFPLDPRALAEAEYELRTQVRQVVLFLKNNIPGFAHIRVNGSSVTTGVRESRRVVGDYVLSAEDLFAGRRFDDAVVTDAHFCIDIHNPDGAGQAERDGCPYTPQPYEIPYRSMTAKGFDNLLTAGRCISGDHRAHASYRVMRICMAMGHAAGVAAALMSEGGLTSREIDIRRVQRAVGIRKDAEASGS
ncbi:MAG: FAD-dependent oxidoreductase [Clostridia bacterium]|nr:FAD-dependent oxidoreductase [Clostridia bacterium]